MKPADDRTRKPISARARIRAAANMCRRAIAEIEQGTKHDTVSFTTYDNPAANPIGFAYSAHTEAVSRMAVNAIEQAARPLEGVLY